MFILLLLRAFASTSVAFYICAQYAPAQAGQFQGRAYRLVRVLWTHAWRRSDIRPNLTASQISLSAGFFRTKRIRASRLLPRTTHHLPLRIGTSWREDTVDSAAGTCLALHRHMHGGRTSRTCVPIRSLSHLIDSSLSGHRGSKALRTPLPPLAYLSVLRSSNSKPSNRRHCTVFISDARCRQAGQVVELRATQGTHHSPQCWSTSWQERN